MTGKSMFLMLLMWSGAALAGEPRVTIAKDMPHSVSNATTQGCRDLPSRNVTQRNYMNKGMEIRSYKSGRDAQRAHNADDTWCENYGASAEQLQKLPYAKR